MVACGSSEIRSIRASQRCDFPMPGSPPMRTTWPSRRLARSQSANDRRNSGSRPTSRVISSGCLPLKRLELFAPGRRDRRSPFGKLRRSGTAPYPRKQSSAEEFAGARSDEDGIGRRRIAYPCSNSNGSPRACSRLASAEPVATATRACNGSSLGDTSWPIFTIRQSCVHRAFGIVLVDSGYPKKARIS